MIMEKKQRDQPASNTSSSAYKLSVLTNFRDSEWLLNLWNNFHRKGLYIITSLYNKVYVTMEIVLITMKIDIVTMKIVLITMEVDIVIKEIVLIIIEIAIITILLFDY